VNRMARCGWIFGLVLAACAPREGKLASIVPLPDMPAAGVPAVWSPPSPVRVEMASGLPLYVREDHQLPLVSLRIEIPTGSVDDAARWGTAALTAAMLEESSGGLTSLQRAAALERLAAQFSVGVGREWTTVALDVHRDRLAEALPLVADALLRPSFAAEDWERVHQRHITGLEQDQDDNATVASVVAPRILFGDAHPYGHPVSGTPTTARAVDLEAVKSFFASQFHAGGAAFVVVGDVDPATVKQSLETSFGAWKSQARAPRTYAAAAPRPGRFFVDSPDSTQTVLRVVMPGPSGTDPARDAADLARVVLGGSFTSRLNQKLREEKGYTYGARVGISRWLRGGMASASSSVRGDATAPALTDLIGVLDGARKEGFLPNELDKARAQALADLVESAESRSNVAGLYTMEIDQGRDPLNISAAGSAVMAVDAAAMQRATEQFLDPARATIVLVGDKAAVMNDLDKAGFKAAEWVMLDKEGHPLP
jgi:zinc protease